MDFEVAPRNNDTEVDFVREPWTNYSHVDFVDGPRTNYPRVDSVRAHGTNYSQVDFRACQLPSLPLCSSCKKMQHITGDKTTGERAKKML